MKYIVAVSGGLDSVVLLDMLSKSAHDKTKADFVVGHVNHGIRDDADADTVLARKLAKKYGLEFETVELRLGVESSEEEARNARYEWLESIRVKHGADGIITAHHQDDLLETIVLNFKRGTGWRGLSSLRTSRERYRPLIGASKASLVRYAIDHKLEWREDSTNDDVRYLRNYIRHGVMPRLNGDIAKKLLSLAENQRQLREEIEAEAGKILADIKDGVGISRYRLIMMPDNVALEVLRTATTGKHEPFHLRRLLHFAKTGRQGTILNLGKGNNALLTRQRLIV